MNSRYAKSSKLFSLEKLWDLFIQSTNFKSQGEAVLMTLLPINEHFRFYKFGGLYTFTESVVFLAYYIDDILPDDLSDEVLCDFCFLYIKSFVKLIKPNE